jgi:hypothetical protein
MNTTRKIVLLTLAFVVLGVALRTLMSTPVNAASGPLPFHAVIQGYANPFPIDQCTLGNHETASGTAVHLGRISWTSDEVAQFLSCPPPGPAIAVTGHFTIVAANGDEIHGTYQTSGTFDPINGVSVSGPYTLVSGTGRFSNVTGSGIIRAQGAATPPFDVVGSLDGTISYPRQ